MKKYLIIGLLLLAGVAMILQPLLSDNTEIPVESEIPASFTFKDNLASTWNKIIPIEIEIKEGVETLELIFNDSTFQTWKQAKGKITYQFNASFYGLGTYELVLKSTMKNGETFLDNRFVRILSDVKPSIIKPQIIASFPHNPTSFTQGLEFHDGQLFESTGQKGASIVAQVDYKSGVIKKQIGLDGNYFGEGITILNGKVYQLTWQEQKCFVYDSKTLTIEKDIAYTGEGWGICNNGKSLIMSDGTERITFRNPESFEIEKTIEIYDDKGPITKLNELEYVNGLIYANVWMTNSIVVIQPENGKVLSVVDCTELVNLGRGMGDVLNGIAHQAKSNTFFLTGKNWLKLFEVKL